jgi:RimJ/RimL family protein N-acetyltransferase
MARRRLWDSETHLVLRCELAGIPPVPPAQVPIAMVETDVSTFRGFELELTRAQGSDAHDTRARMRACEDGVESLYVAHVDGEPAYCQWLVRRRQQPAIQRHSPRTYRPLGEGEVLLEGAYTFTAFRGKKAMAAGMVQLLHIARDEGATAAITYVAADNVPSLRGCARVGFALDGQRIKTVRLGRRRVHEVAADDTARAAWQAATT